MAAPTRIPVHSKRNQYKGTLGIMDNVALRLTEYQALYPQSEPRQPVKPEPPPMYTDDDGTRRYMIQCSRCQSYQRHAAFGSDARNTGRDGRKSVCRTCQAALEQNRRRGVKLTKT